MCVCVCVCMMCIPKKQGLRCLLTKILFHIKLKISLFIKVDITFISFIS